MLHTTLSACFGGFRKSHMAPMKGNIVNRFKVIPCYSNLTYIFLSFLNINQL